MSHKDARPVHSAWELAVATAVTLMALIMRLVGLPGNALWYDELQSVTYAYLPWRELVPAVWQLDPHPPLYYMQLHLWMLAGTSDLWTKLNSVLWSILATISLYLAVRRIYGLRTAALASGFFALSPFAIMYAQEVRMYSMLMCLGVLAWLLTWELYRTKLPLVVGMGLLIVTLACLYSQGAAFVMLVSTSVYALLLAMSDWRTVWRRFMLWTALLLMVLALYAPWLQRAATITVGHTLVPGIDDIALTLAYLVAGFSPNSHSWLLVVSVAFLVAVTVASMWHDPAMLRMVISFLIAPIVFCIAVSYLYRAIWLYRTLAYLSPFICIAAGRALLRLTSWRSVSHQPLLSAILPVLVGCCLILLTYLNSQYHHPWRIRDASEFVARLLRPGEAIYVPDERLYWCFNWYFIGPGSVNPLHGTPWLVSKTGIRVNMDSGAGSAHQTDWLVFRQGNDVTPWDTWTLHIVGDFDHMYVARFPASAVDPEPGLP